MAFGISSRLFLLVLWFSASVIISSARSSHQQLISGFYNKGIRSNLKMETEACKSSSAADHLRSPPRNGLGEEEMNIQDYEQPKPDPKHDPHAPPPLLP
ncbi:hypothetical protein ACOSQ2_017390 [Xanthoceras sorbifolium]